MKLPQIQHRFVNWRNGMKVTQRHLTANDLAVRDTIRDVSATFLNDFNYGILRAERGTDLGLQLNMLGDTISLRSCRAITPGGIRIEWDAREEPDAVSLSLLDYKDRVTLGGVFYVVLRASLAGTVEDGAYDMEEIPLRKPFLTLKPMMELVPSYETLSDAYTIPIFRVRFEGQLFVPDYEYIPPTAGLFGDNLLWYYETCGKQIASLQQTATQILRKINGMQQQSPIARDVARLATAVVSTGLQVIDSYRLIARESAPVHFVHGLVRYARAVRTELDCMSEHSGARLYHYLRSNVGGTTKFNMHVPEVSKSLMDNMIDGVLAVNYDHNDCGTLLDSIKSYLDFMEFVFQNLLALPYVDAAKWDIA